MKKIFVSLIIAFITATGISYSCKKEKSCSGCIENKPPIAVAGPDQVITLPTDSASLDGRSSIDPDGTISEWLWKKISGPASFNIISATTAKTGIENLAIGIYQFELKVTDDGGLPVKDTVSIVVNDPSVNHQPIANAGINQTIVLPIKIITLNGSGSSDLDNNIKSYVWTKISRPSSFNIANTNVAVTQVDNLVEGVFQFELKVTDAEGLFSKDTVQITVTAATLVACNNTNRTIISARLVSIGTLSQSRTGMAVASAGNKILFAGGVHAQRPTSRVDIYDLNTNTWSMAELCVGRYAMAAVASGNKIFFGGGEVGDGTWPVDSVDIYNMATNTWATSHLSAAGNGIVGASIGNKVFFSGGDPGFSGGANRYTSIDIYDLTSDTWPKQTLREGKRAHAAVAINGKVYFAGGEAWSPDPDNPPYNHWYASKNIEIYDNATNTWSTSEMQEGKISFAGIVAGHKIYWAGGLMGTYPATSRSCLVEIKNLNTGNSSPESLFAPAGWDNSAGQNAVVKGNKIIFVRLDGGVDANKFDIYNIDTESWSIGVLPQSITGGASVISVNNEVYIAGGGLSNQVWKLEF